MEIDGFVSVLYAGLTSYGDSETTEARRGWGSTKEGNHPPEYYAAQRFIDDQRRPKGYNAITDDLLKAVAEVYRNNINRAPTQAVAKTFRVKSRMASTYVDRARKAGYLPKTSQGRKNA
jgi:hypothetical protein